MAKYEGTPKYEGLIKINGVNVWEEMKRDVTEIQFEDFASGQSDNLDITVEDSEGRFINEWAVDKGTEFDAQLRLMNWQTPGDEQSIDFGNFLCDEIDINGFPIEVKIRALALPTFGTKNTKKWEQISISQIATDICSNLGVELIYYADDIIIDSRQQSSQTDIDFLYSLCNEYGFGMKAFRRKIIIFDRERQDAAEAVSDIDIYDIAGEGFTIKESTEGTYTGAKCNYKTKNSDKEVTYTYGTTERVLVVSATAASAKEAELKARAALYEANSQAVKLTASYRGGDIPMYAGNNYKINGLGVYSGKYAVDSVTHSIGKNDGYTVSIEAHGIELLKDGR